MATPVPVLPTPAYENKEESLIGAFFDVDNTLVPGHSTEVRFFHHLWKLGLIGLPQFLKSTWFLIKHIPPLSLSPLRRNKLYLIGLQPGVIEPLAKEFIQTTICPRLSFRGGAVLSRHQREGHTIALISGSPEFLVLPLAEALGVSVVRAARLQIIEDSYTGRVIAPLPYGPAKRRMVEDLASQYGLDLKRSYAYGDSPGDFHALQAVGHPYVINPIRGMARKARQQGWPVSHWV